MGEMDMTTQDDASKTLDYNAHIDRERVLAYFTGRGMSIELARRLVDDAAPMATPGNPTKDTMNTFPEPDINETASYLAVKISTDPDKYTPGMRALAKVYESQRERIADLEEDVERLRPKEAFVPVTVFKSSNAKKDIEVESLGDGLLRVTVEDENSHDYVGIDLPKEKGLELTTALAKWAGLDGVEWRSIDNPPDNDRLLLFTASGTTMTSAGYINSGIYIWAYDKAPTHWAPLPKPPVQS